MNYHNILFSYLINHINHRMFIQQHQYCLGQNPSNPNKNASVKSETMESLTQTSKQHNIDTVIKKTNSKLLKLVKGYIREAARKELCIPECLNGLFHSYYTIINENNKDLLNIMHQQEILQHISTNLQQLDLYHDILRQLLIIQTGQSDNNYLYWTALLLYIIGDIYDIEILWKAKESDLDRFSHFNSNYLIGSGIEKTLKYCYNNNLPIIHNHIKKCKQRGEFQQEFDPLDSLRSYVDDLKLNNE